MEMIIKILQEDSLLWSLTKDFVCFHSDVSKICANIKEMVELKKENLLVDSERNDSIRREKSKQYTWKIENVQQMKDKQFETGVTAKNGWMKLDLHREKPSKTYC